VRCESCLGLCSSTGRGAAALVSVHFWAEILRGYPSNERPASAPSAILVAFPDDRREHRGPFRPVDLPGYPRQSASKRRQQTSKCVRVHALEVSIPPTMLSASRNAGRFLLCHQPSTHRRAPSRVVGEAPAGAR
jgi:hypothetical protein